MFHVKKVLCDWLGVCSHKRPTTEDCDRASNEKRSEYECTVVYYDNDGKLIIKTVKSTDSWGIIKYSEEACGHMALFGSCEGMFRYALSDCNMLNWDVSGVTNMRHMFEKAKYFNRDISEWDVSGVTDMSYMFRDAESFNSDLSRWDVSEVMNMACMFCNARSFNQDISMWDVSGVTNMRWMFCGAKSFDQDISAWDIRNVADMGLMFCGSGVSKAPTWWGRNPL